MPATEQKPVSTIPGPFGDFCREHGAYVQDTDGACYFEDGALVRGSDSPLLASWTAPPTDPFALLNAKRLYVTVKLSQEIRDFETFQTDSLQQAKYHASSPSFCPPPRADAADQLAAGKARIHKLRKQHAELLAEIRQTPEDIARRKQEQRDRELVQKNSERWQEILGVTTE